jgi:hypothetical protein
MCKTCANHLSRKKNDAESSVNKSASAQPYNRTIFRTVEKCPTTGSGWDKRKQSVIF